MTAEWNKKDRAARPEVHQIRNRRDNLWRLYRLTPEEYDRRRAEQGHRCAICQRHEDEIPVGPAGRPRADGSRATRLPLVPDHDHKTGEVRKLLCDRCNHVIGHAQESREILLAAAEYLS